MCFHASILITAADYSYVKILRPCHFRLLFKSLRCYQLDENSLLICDATLIVKLLKKKLTDREQKLDR